MSAMAPASWTIRWGSVAGGAPESATPPSPRRVTRRPVLPISAVSVARTADLLRCPLVVAVPAARALAPGNTITHHRAYHRRIRTTRRANVKQEARRAGYADELRAAVLRRFGAERAEALAKAIEDTAGWMAEVAAFPVDQEEPPAFYLEREP